MIVCTIQIVCVEVEKTLLVLEIGIFAAQKTMVYVMQHRIFQIVMITNTIQRATGSSVRFVGIGQHIIIG